MTLPIPSAVAQSKAFACRHCGARMTCPQDFEEYQHRDCGGLVEYEPPWPLTKRELQVAVALAYGRRNADIASALSISIKTVDTHRQHILKKLEIKNNVELARLAIRDGMVGNP